eukprot:Blabericola_migrator_1__10855@NODE_624_length_7189_cov_211_722269_g455_i0_p3_GENE_NODE_624_length_7189_cov_211_722269_g455_i0NODE_624_length_7189_cov_211_722269_g455_i0_p3_ORF_typecomplete_len250_score52_56DapH_N/PF08503_10/0_0097_NODE_624_length_7189_cov_211_722269_g455_i057936542
MYPYAHELHYQLGSDGIFGALDTAIAVDSALMQESATPRGRRVPNADLVVNAWTNLLFGDRPIRNMIAAEDIKETDVEYEVTDSAVPLLNILKWLSQMHPPTPSEGDSEDDDDPSDSVGDAANTTVQIPQAKPMSNLAEKTEVMLEEFAFPWDDRPASNVTISPASEDDADEIPEDFAVPADKEPAALRKLHIRGCGKQFGPGESLRSQLHFKGASHMEQLGYGLRMICLLTSDDCSFQVLKLPGFVLR